jgi:hypothetical protein
MAEATTSLPQAHSLVDRGWVRVEALRLAKNAVKTDIRDKGLRLKDYEAKEITILAERWFSDHKASLIGQATITLLLARGSVFAIRRNSEHSLRRQAHKAKEFSR